MSKLLVIRHAQASFMSVNYDQLSLLGEKQSIALGRYLIERGVRIDKAIIGPLKRHHQTADFVKEAAVKNGYSWNWEEHPEFEEHQAPQITKHFLAQSIDPFDTNQTESEEEKKKIYFHAFNKTFRKWVRNELDLSNTPFEKWVIFRDRVLSGLEKVLTENDNGQTTAIFTSGGPAGVITGAALGLEDEKTMELSWMIANASVSEFLFSKGRFSLKSFNNIAHLQPKWATLV